MSSRPVHRIKSTKKGAPAALATPPPLDGSDFHGSPPSSLNAPAAAPNTAQVDDANTHFQRPSRRAEESTLLPHPRNQKARGRRSRTPRNGAARLSVGDDVRFSGSQPHPLRAAATPIPAGTTSPSASTRRPAHPVGSVDRSLAAPTRISLELTAPSAPPAKRSTSRSIRVTDVTSRSPPRRSRSANVSVSQVHLRTSVGPRSSDLVRLPDVYTPAPSSHSVADSSTATVASNSAHTRGDSLVPAVTLTRREISSGSPHGLVTPRPSQHNSEELSRLTPVKAVSSNGGSAAEVSSPSLPWRAWGGAATSNRGSSDTSGTQATAAPRLSGAAFVTPAHTGDAAAIVVERSPDAMKPEQPAAVRHLGSLTHHPANVSATSKERYRRASSATASTPHREFVPALSPSKLQQSPHGASKSPSQPFRHFRATHQTTVDAAPAATCTPSVSFNANPATQHVREDSLATSASSAQEGRSTWASASAFLPQDILAINEVHATDAASASLANTTPAVGNTTPRNSAAMNASWLQRGASTPRAGRSPRAEYTSLDGSPTNRSLRTHPDVSGGGGNTPRLSTSTPRFTVATNANGVSYTARQSRDGTPISIALLLSSAPAAPAENPSVSLSQSSAPTGTNTTGTFIAATAATPAAVAIARGSFGGLSASPETFMQRDSQDYVVAVADEVARHFYVILTALDIGRGAALEAEPPQALCLRSMLIDLNTVASLLSYDSRNGIQDLLFEDCAFATMDLTWLSRLRRLYALRFKGPTMTTAVVNRLLAHAPHVRTVTFIHTARITSLSSLTETSSPLKVRCLQVIQTDFSSAAYAHMVNCASLYQIMLLQVQLRTNIFDLLNTNHLVELHVVGCPNVFYQDIPESEWVSCCSPRHEDLAAPPPPPVPTTDSNSNAQRITPSRSSAAAAGHPRGRNIHSNGGSSAGGRATRGGRGRGGRGSASAHGSGANKKKQPQPVKRRTFAFPLRTFVVADCPRLELGAIPFADFNALEEVSIMYQRGVRAVDIAGVFEPRKLTTLRLQGMFVDDHLIQQLRRCFNLQELNLSFCRGMQGMQSLWPALADTLRTLNVSYSDVDDAALADLDKCEMLCSVYARGCARLRRFDAFRKLAPSVGVIDLTDCRGLENDGFQEPFACTGVHRLLLSGCEKVRTVTGICALRMLEELDLARTAVDDSCLRAIAANKDSVVLQTLSVLNLSGCRNINALADFAASSSALCSLLCLTLTHSSIGNDGVANLAGAIRGGRGRLTELDLSSCAGVSNLGPLGAVKSLRLLDASFSAVCDDGLASFVATAVSCFNRELRVLRLDGCTGVCNLGFLGQLPRLSALSLSGSTVDGAASFEGLSQCVGLQELDISECMQIDSVVTLVSRLTKLRVVNLSLTRIGDDSVEALGALKELEVLQLSGCARVQNLFPLKALPVLQRLNISATCVTDLTPLTECPQLWDLSVCACSNLTSLQPLANAAMLQRLDAANTPITSDSFQEEWQCASLEELDLHGCSELRGMTPGVLRKLVSLRRVNAHSASLDDSAVAALAECVNLCEVDISYCPVTSLSLLGTVLTLQFIVAQHTQVNEEGLEGLDVSESLTTLDLSGCAEAHNVSMLRTMSHLDTLVLRDSGVTDASFAEPWTRSGVRELNISGCPGIATPALLHTLPSLEVLHVSHSGLSNGGICVVAQCAGLHRLYLAHCTQVTDLSPLLKLSGLTHLDTDGCPIASLISTGAGETAAARDANADAEAEAEKAEEAELMTIELAAKSQLRHVSLRSCAELTNVSVLSYLRHLHTVDLTNGGATAESFEDSWEACASLEEVVLTGCAALTDVRGLWAAPSLMRVRLDRTAVQHLDGAEASSMLEVLDITECRNLKNISSLRDLPRLQHLECRGSGIADESFANAWTAPQLVSVNFAECPDIRDISALGSLPKLRSAAFAETSITDVAVRGLSLAPMLEVLDLRGCKRLAHLSSLFRIPHILALYLSRTSIDNFTFSSLSRCRKLEVLEMEDCPYVTTVFVAFELGQLRSLKFPPLSRIVGSVLRACQNLEYLSLLHCPDSLRVESLSFLSRLRVLDMRESAIPSEALSALCDCPSLEEVDVSYCTHVDSLRAMGPLPRLRSFAASGLRITDDACEALTAYPLLEKVVLAECPLLKDVSALKHLPQLHHLDVSESGVTEASFLGIREMRSLEELSVHQCAAIRGCKLLVEPPSAQRGRSPSSSNGNATDDAAVTVATVRLPRLRLIDLSGTGISRASSAADIAALRRQCPLLTKIYVDGTKGGSSSSVLSALANVWKKLAGTSKAA